MEELTDLQTVVHVCTVSVLFCIISVIIYMYSCPNICKYGPWYSAVIVLSWQWNIFMFKGRDECIRSGWRLNEGYELDVGMYPNLTQLVGCITRRSKRLASATAKNSAGGSSTSTRVVLFTHTNTNTNSQIQIYKYKFTNTNTNSQIQRAEQGGAAHPHTLFSSLNPHCQG